MKALLASIAFMTRIPVPVAFDAEDVGKASRWFPLAGALIGAVYVGISHIPGLPAGALAVLIVVAEALLTGALHMDGLADTADGFGGGRTREDVLRIMRDHAIGTYGAVALILLVAWKVTVIAALIERHQAQTWLILAPALGRWTIVPLSRFVPYARESKAVSRYIGTAELIWATLVAGALVAAMGRWQGALAWGAAAAGAALFARYSMRKIGGVTGDTLGATDQICESLVLLVGLACS